MPNSTPAERWPYVSQLEKLGAEIQPPRPLSGCYQEIKTQLTNPDLAAHPKIYAYSRDKKLPPKFGELFVGKDDLLHVRIGRDTFVIPPSEANKWLIENDFLPTAESPNKNTAIVRNPLLIPQEKAIQPWTIEEQIFATPTTEPKKQRESAETLPFKQILTEALRNPNGTVTALTIRVFGDGLRVPMRTTTKLLKSANDNRLSVYKSYAGPYIGSYIQGHLVKLLVLGALNTAGLETQADRLRASDVPNASNYRLVFSHGYLFILNNGAIDHLYSS